MGRGRNYGQENLERKFWNNVRAALDKAKELGHDPQWIRDDTTEAAFWCDDCLLWGRVVMTLTQREPDDTGGRLLEVACTPDACHNSEPELHWNFNESTLTLPSMFAGLGYEPKEVKNGELISPHTKVKVKTRSVWNSGRKG